MRVALLSYNARPADAIGNQVAEKVAFFRERGADVRVFVQVDDIVHPEVRPCCRLMKKPIASGANWEFLAAADLFFAEFGQYFTLLELLPLLASAPQKSRPRIVLDYHGITPPDLWGNHNRHDLEKGVQDRGLVWCADAVIVHSRFTERELRDEVGYPAARLQRIAYPIERSLFGPGELEHDWREQLGLGDARLLLYVGRLASNKRVPLLVEALARLRDVQPPVHALIVGTASDLYQVEAERCTQLANELGVADRLHLVGPQTGIRLRDAYRAADVFVMPSAWESFCIPVIEAMACGVPVVAARSTVLPETVASAGLTFTPDDAADLARQIRRVFSEPMPSIEVPSAFPRVAIVSVRYGNDFVGGEKTSLATIAHALQDCGCRVEVFTTTTRTTSAWRDEMPAGTSEHDGVLVHRFRIDPHDDGRHREIVERIGHAQSRVPPALEQEYLQHSVCSEALLEALEQRQGEFDALIFGPYLYALTYETARRLPAKTLLLPCFHDEPLARLDVWQSVYAKVAGILYHSPEEQAWTERELGLNHPGGVLLGTYVDTQTKGDAEHGRAAVGGAARYVVYCGRYCAHKELRRLIEYARRFEQQHPGQITFAFLGHGEVTIPREPWARDLGFVDEQCKRDVLAGAAALLQLSRNESLSLVALEAWAQGTPVIASARCEVLAGQIERCGGGWLVDDYKQFARALNDLCQQPQEAVNLGQAGLDYVRRTYGSRQAFSGRLLESLADMSRPLAERMRQRGLERAAHFDRSAWRSRFAEFVETLLDTEPGTYVERIEVRPRHVERAVAAGSDTVLLPVRVTNYGTHALLADGPGRTQVHCRVSADGSSDLRASVALPQLLMPGHSLSAVVPVPVPGEPGDHRLDFWACLADRAASESSVPACCRLIVHGQEAYRSEQCSAPMLHDAQSALAQAARLGDLPDSYLDVTQGWLASWKKRIKRKLLGNFKHAYVDVLSHQQTAYNHQLVRAVQELTECCASLDHAVRILDRKLTRLKQRLRRKRQNRPLASGGREFSE